MAAGPRNLDRLRAAFDELEAEPVFFPSLSAAVLRPGHACHSRSRAAGLHGLRIDVMSRMRGVNSFDTLWKRREEFELHGIGRIAALSLPDLVTVMRHRGRVRLAWWVRARDVSDGQGATAATLAIETRRVDVEVEVASLTGKPSPPSNEPASSSGGNAAATSF